MTSDLLPFFDPTARPVPQEILERLQGFANAWQGKVGKEQQLAQPFLDDLCRALGTSRPTDGVLPHEDYQYEKIVQVPDSDRKGRIDLYKREHFVLEAKCGRNDRQEEGSAPVRGTAQYAAYIEKAYNDQARVYAQLLPEGRPPVLIVVDVGHQFWVWRRGSNGEYPAFHSPLTIKIPLARVADEELARVLWLAFEDPQALDPSRFQERVTREVAEVLAKLAKPLQEREDADTVARFLIQCLFCMFAEDVGLLDDGLFTKILKTAGRHPQKFRPMLLELFGKMRDGGMFGMDPVRRFNGALFDEPCAIDLTSADIGTLSQAAARNWAFVEPAIFGTLIERALDPEKRRKLGAHYTPRSFVERLVRPVVEEPLRQEWEIEVKPEAAALWEKADEADAERATIDASTAEGRKRFDRLKSDANVARRDALALLDAFRHRLTRVRVLDPACGTGNFLYVAYDVVKSLEFEVLEQRRDWAPEASGQLGLTVGATSVGAVAPSQMLGIEVEGFAAEIAQLTLWIGHLQWELRHRKRPEDLPEPIIPPVRTIEHRDALLTWQSTTPRLDEDGEPVTRWKVGAYKPATTHEGEVPDESVREPVVDYVGVEKAAWPEAEFIVGNPPFIGNKMMRLRLGDGYVEALRSTYDDVPDTVDFVMYWWHRAALRARAGEARRFGFITTNSLRQTFNRKVLVEHLGAKKDPARLVLAVPDHPWVDDGADVRISMTAGEQLPTTATSSCLVIDVVDETSAVQVETSDRRVPVLHADLRDGADATSAVPLMANAGLCAHGPNPYGAGFRLSEQDLEQIGLDASDLPAIVRPYIGARDISQSRRTRYTIDALGLSASDLQREYPACYQWLLDRVKPERDQKRDRKTRENWWLYGRPREELRPMLSGLKRFIVTPETSKYRIFVFQDAHTLADHTTLNICTQAWWHFGVLHSRVHEAWSLATCGWLGVGNDPRYSNSKTFAGFPFPDESAALAAGVHTAARALHDYRTAAQARSDDLTLTTIYNLVAARRAGETLSGKDVKRHTLLGTDTLIALHDALDRAVAAAYGWDWPLDEQEILTRLVALNHERAREEARGHVRWLRPDRAQEGAKGTAAKEVARAAQKAQVPWPKDRKDQRRQVFAAIDGATTAPTLAELAKGFKGAGAARVGEMVRELEELGFVVEGDGGVWRRA